MADSEVTNTTAATDTIEATDDATRTDIPRTTDGDPEAETAGTNCDVEATGRSLDESELSYWDGASSKVNATILSFVPEDGEIEPGDTQCARVTIENTGTTTEDFFVGYSVRGPDGEGYHDEGPTEPKVTLAPGESETVVVEWTVTSSAPFGEYDAGTTVWRDLDEETDDLDGKIVSASKTDVFEVVSATA